MIHQFAALRGALTTVEHSTSFCKMRSTIWLPRRPHPEPVAVAEITASAFAITKHTTAARPLSAALRRGRGRPHPRWSSATRRGSFRFAGDRNVVGREVILGGVPRTVVGVMPEGFEFPTVHQFWIPLREDPLRYKRGDGPSLSLFGRFHRA